VIALERKVDECKVFDLSSDECLNYAISNPKVIVQKYQQASKIK
jgi:hypothetical protein